MREIKISNKEQERLGLEINKIIKNYKLNKILLSIFMIITLILLSFAFKYIGNILELEFAFGSLYVLFGVVITTKITTFIEKIYEKESMIY